MTNLYPYAQKDRLVETNTYFYTPTIGSELIAAWEESRNRSIENFNKNISNCSNEKSSKYLTDTSGNYVRAKDLIRSIAAKLSDGIIDASTEICLRKLTKKFEVFKRLHGSYDGNFKAVDKSDCIDPNIYIGAAEILLTAYRLKGELQYLNVSMKVIDTLCSESFVLLGSNAKRMIRLIEIERLEVSNLARSIKNEA
jgi:hypothetical protein